MSKPQKSPKRPEGVSKAICGEKMAPAGFARLARPHPAAGPTLKNRSGDPGAPGNGLPDLALAGQTLAQLGADQTTAPQLRPGLAASGSVSLTRRLAAISRWRDYYDPLVGFTMAQAVALSQDYTRGWLADLQWMYFYLEWQDPDLFALVERRTSRLLEMDCTAKVEKEADKVLAAEQAAMIEERMGRIDNLYEAIEHLAMASFRGYAHCEKWHDETGELTHLEIVDQWNVVRDGLRGGWKYNPRAWQVGYFGLADEMKMEPQGFVIREVRRHINRLALLKYVSRKLTETDWDAFIEIYAIPSGVVIGPQNVTTETKAEFEAAADEIAKGGSGYLPYGSLYEKNDMPGGGAPFKERLEYLTEKLILVGTGGMLTMLAKSGSGTLAGGAHSDVFEQIAKAEAGKISAVLNRALVDEWLARDFPGQPKAARFALSANEETKLGDVVEHIAKLYSAGLAVDPQDASERTGYKLTRLAPPAAPGAEPDGDEDPDGDDDGEQEQPGAAPAGKGTAKNRRIRNAATPRVDAGRAVFDRNAQRRLTAAQTEAVQPLLDRLAALKDLPDDEFAPALKELRDQLPRLFAEARLHAPDIADVWEQVLAAALVDGLAEKPAPVSKS